MKRSEVVTALGQVVELIMGQAPSSKDCNFDGKGTPFVKVGEFGLTRPVIREWTTNPLRMARKSDVLLCVVGATCGKINLGEDCSIGRSVAAIRPIVAKLDQFYLFYFMMTLVERLRSGSVGAAQTVISKEMISSVEMPLPSLPEQLRIVAILDKAFDGIAIARANAEKNLKNARELFESHLQAVFTQRGDGWVEKPLGEIADLLDCLHKTPTYTDSGFPMVRVTDIKAGFLDLSKTRRVDEKTFIQFSKKYTPKVGDIVFSRVGSCGVSSLVNSDEPFCLGQNTIFILPKINSMLLYRFLNSPYAKEQFVRFIEGTTQPTISMKSIRKIVVPIPPEIEQNRLVTSLDAIHKKVQRLESLYQQKITALDELKKALLHKAFSCNL